MVNFAKCNEIKIVERDRERSRECVSPSHPKSVRACMNKSNDEQRRRRHVVKVGKRTMIIISSLTRSHSWTMKVPQGNNNEARIIVRDCQLARTTCSNMASLLFFSD